MKTSDLRELGDAELEVQARTTTEELWKLRFSHHTGQLTNTASLRTARRKLAKIATLQNERSRGIGATGKGK